MSYVYKMCISQERKHIVIFCNLENVIELLNILRL